MKTVAAIYTGIVIVDPVRKRFAQKYPDHRLINLLDDSLIADVIRAGRMTDTVLKRIFAYCREMELAGVDLILQTCSSVGDSATLIAPFIGPPILRIDRPMAEAAVAGFKRIGVMATLPTTLNPTSDLLRRVSDEKGRPVTIEQGLAEGAFEALNNGDPETHDRLILQTAEKLKSVCDVFVLAQGSMARMAEDLERVSGKPVLSSLESGLDSLAPYLNG